MRLFMHAHAYIAPDAARVGTGTRRAARFNNSPKFPPEENCTL